MKTTLLLLLIMSTSLSFADEVGVELQNAKAKIELVRKIGKHLGVDFAKEKEWTVKFLRAKKGSTLYNVLVSNTIHEALKLSDGKLRKYAEEKVKNPRPWGGSLNPLESNSLQMQIQGTEYHHSWIFGNHAEKFTSFNVGLSDVKFTVESLIEKSGYLEAVTVQEAFDDGKAYQYYQKIIIESAAKPIRMKISNWRPWRLESTKTVEIESSELHANPIKTKQD